MKFTLPVVPLLLVGGLLLAGCESQDDAGKKSAAAAAKKFYDTLTALRISGLPNDQQTTVLAPLLADEVRALIEKAREEQKEFIKANPDEKPPYIEGDHFSSSFEGFNGFEIGEPKIEGTFANVPVKLVYRQGAEFVQWTDELILVNDGVQWKVWNMEFRGEWPFKTAATLRKAFGDAANE